MMIVFPMINDSGSVCLIELASTKSTKKAAAKAAPPEWPMWDLDAMASIQRGIEQGLRGEGIYRGSFSKPSRD